MVQCATHLMSQRFQRHGVAPTTNGRCIRKTRTPDAPSCFGILRRSALKAGVACRLPLYPVMRHLRSRGAGSGRSVLHLRVVERTGRTLPRTEPGVDSAVVRSIAERRRERMAHSGPGIPDVAQRLSARTGDPDEMDWRVIAGGIGGAMAPACDRELPPPSA